MSTTKHHDDEVSCNLELPGVVTVGPAPHCAIAATELAESVRTALAAPLGYPPLAAATVPGDRVVVALDAGLPMVRELVAGISRALEDAGVDESLVTFLYREESTGGTESFDEWMAQHGLHAERHDPSDENGCAMFGVLESGNALRLNRKLCDADIVLPIGVLGTCLNSSQPQSSGVFPQFSDEQTIARYAGAEGTKHRGERLAEIEESGWLLGLGLAVQVVPGRSGSIAAVLAGEPGTLAAVAAQQYRDIWQRAVDSGGDLVVATLNGPSSEQAWESVARALIAAEEVLERGGAIAICTQLAEAPGLSLRKLADNDDYAKLERKLEREPVADSGAALTFCRALQRGPVYLQSRLKAELVESLGLTPIASNAELQRLVKSYRRPIVLEDAHRLLPELKSPDRQRSSNR